MTIEEAAKRLAAMYREAPEREKSLSVHLFGIKYAEQIDGIPAHDIAERADLPRSYGTEIRKGIRLARYVQLRDAT